MGQDKVIPDFNSLAAMLAAIVESCEDAIVSKDLNGIVTSWNAGAQRIFEYRSDEIIGRPITCIIPPELQEDESESWRNSAAGSASSISKRCG